MGAVSMRYWLGRLGFSFLIVGSALAWEAFAAARGDGMEQGRARIVAYWAGAGACWVVGLIGIRIRHGE
jgi:hypothetical protein